MSKKTCELIIQSGNDYVIAVKDNQPKLHNNIKRVASEQKPTSIDIRTEKTRDRITTSIVEVFHDLNRIDPEWTGIKSLIKVERTGTRAGKKYHEVVCYISSLILSAKEFSLGIRGHWGARKSPTEGLRMLFLMKTIQEYVWAMPPQTSRYLKQ